MSVWSKLSICEERKRWAYVMVKTWWKIMTQRHLDCYNVRSMKGWVCGAQWGFFECSAQRQLKSNDLHPWSIQGQPQPPLRQLPHQPAWIAWQYLSQNSDAGSRWTRHTMGWFCQLSAKVASGKEIVSKVVSALWVGIQKEYSWGDWWKDRRKVTFL